MSLALRSMNINKVSRFLTEIRIGLFRQFESGLALRSLHVNKVSQFFTEIGISEFRVFRVFRQIERSLAVTSFI